MVVKDVKNPKFQTVVDFILHLGDEEGVSYGRKFEKVSTHNFASISRLTDYLIKEKYLKDFRKGRVRYIELTKAGWSLYEGFVIAEDIKCQKKKGKKKK